MHGDRPPPPPTTLPSVLGGTTVSVSRINICSLYCNIEYLITQTQMATISYTPDGKYRPDLVSAPQNILSLSQLQDCRRLDSTTTRTQLTLQSSSSSAIAHQQPRASDQPRGPVNGAIEAASQPQYHHIHEVGMNEVSTFISIGIYDLSNRWTIRLCRSRPS